MPTSLLKTQSKLPKVGTTVFTVMSQLATEHRAVNLSQGFPDFEPDTKLKQLINKHLKGNYNQYAPMPGIIGLREQIAAKTEKLYGKTYDPNTEITITAGGTQAIFTAIASIIKEGDEVIVFEPAYDCYIPSIELFGGIARIIEMEPPNFNIDWAKVKKLVTAKTRMILINSPHNPSGAILSEKDIKELIAITKNTDILILSDEVYEHIIFDGATHHSMAKYPELAERSFVIASFGKILHATGWKVGYCLAPKELMAEFRKVHQFNVFSVNTPYQHAIATYLKEERIYLDLGRFYEEKRDYFVKALSATKFKLLPVCGSYFQTLSYAEYSTEADVNFAKHLIQDFKVASIPVSAFYSKGIDHHLLRFCFAKNTKTLDKAVNNLLKL